jgi:hypothetical protein
MKSLIFLIILSATTARAELASNIPEYTRDVIRSIQSGGQSCGLRFETAPPNLQTPADYVVLSSAGIIIAHILDRAGGFAVKHPRGGNVHWIEYSWEWFKVATPQGTVAHANRYTTGHGWQYNYYCRSVMVNPIQFDQCVIQGFTQVVVQRLCAAG